MLTMLTPFFLKFNLLFNGNHLLYIEHDQIPYLSSGYLKFGKRLSIRDI